MALADGLGAGGEGKLAVTAIVFVEAQFDVFLRRAEGGLHVIADAEPAQIARHLRRGLAFGEALGCARHGGLDILRKVAAVDHRADGVDVGHGAGGWHVLPAEVRRVAAGLRRRPVHQPLYDVGELGKAGAAGDAGRHGVGVDRAHIHMHRRNAVGAARQLYELLRKDARHAAGEVCTQIAAAPHFQRGDGAAGIQRQFGARVVVPRLVIGDEALAAARDPLHRPARHPRGPTEQHHFGVQKILHTEAAADVRRDEANLGRLNAQRLRHPVAGGVQALGGYVEGVALRRGIEHADAAAQLHGVGGDTVVVQVEPGDMSGAGKGRLRRNPVAHLPLQAQALGVGGS